eukprot:448801-Heterocapsa_arctica.AAC.1
MKPKAIPAAQPHRRQPWQPPQPTLAYRRTGCTSLVTTSTSQVDATAVTRAFTPTQPDRARAGGRAAASPRRVQEP